MLGFELKIQIHKVWIYFELNGFPSCLQKVPAHFK